MQAMLDYARFSLDTGTTSLELYLDVAANSVQWQKFGPARGYTAQLHMQVVAIVGGVVVAQEEQNIGTPAVSDTAGLSFPITTQMRLRLPAREVDMRLTLTDKHATPVKDFSVLVTNLRIPLAFAKDEKPRISDVQLLRGVESTDDMADPYAKSGFRLIPSPTNYLGPDRKKLLFYTELYGLHKLLTDTQTTLLNYRILKLPTYEILADFGGSKRVDAEANLPLVRELDITDLPSGHYRLQLALLDTKNKIIALQNKDFFRGNPTADKPRIATEKATPVRTSGTWVDSISGKNIKLYVYHLGAIASKAEYATVDLLVKGRDYASMRSFYLEFWTRRDKMAPEEAHLEYRRKVRDAQNRFGNKSRPLLEYDRARVFLRYGEPNQMLDEMTDPERNLAATGIRYERWRYYALETAGGASADFIFLRDEATSQYVLTHSTAPNERRNDNWRSLTRPTGIR